MGRSNLHKDDAYGGYSRDTQGLGLRVLHFACISPVGLSCRSCRGIHAGRGTVQHVAVCFQSGYLDPKSM